MRQFIASLSAVVLISSNLLGWGREGHQIVAAVAMERLTDATSERVQELLGTSRSSLVTIANWADQVRHQRDSTYNWHFVDIPKSEKAFDHDRDCFEIPSKTGHEGADSDHNDCVVDRIGMFQKGLADSSQDKKTRLEALKFLVHFVGDIHQPFHAIGDGKGANDNKITLFKTGVCPFAGKSYPCNLHAAWDDGLLEHTGLSLDVYVGELDKLIDAENLDTKDVGSPESWANESHKDAVRFWVPNGGVVDETYFKTARPIIDERLALAGIRLAALLNSALGKD